MNKKLKFNKNYTNYSVALNKDLLSFICDNEECLGNVDLEKNTLAEAIHKIDGINYAMWSRMDDGSTWDEELHFDVDILEDFDFNQVKDEIIKQINRFLVFYGWEGKLL